MNICRIEARDFRSWADLRLDIEPGVTLLSGPNGSGKSSTLEAVDVALFGCSSDAGRYIRRGTDEARVQVDVETLEGPLTVERSIRRSGGTVRVGLKVWGAEVELTAATVTETQAALERALGVTREVLHASAFSFQHSGTTFTEASPRDRKRIFSEILALGFWDTLADEARAEMKAHKDRAALAQALVEQHDGAAERRAEAAKRALQAGDVLKAARISEQDADAEATRLAAEAEAAREARRQHAAAVEAAARARADHERATTERAAADEALQRAKDAAANAPSIEDARAAFAEAESALADEDAALTGSRRRHEAYGEQRAEVEEKLNELCRARDRNGAEILDLANRIREAKKGRCPECHQTLHDDTLLVRLTERQDSVVEANAPVVAEMDPLWDRLANLAENHPPEPDDTPVLAARARVQAAAAALAEAETIQSLAGSIDAAEARARDAFNRELQTLEAFRLTAEESVELGQIASTAYAGSEQNHATALTALDAARVAHRDAALDLARAEAAAQQAERDAQSEADARAKLAAAQADAAVAVILAAGFGPQGVPALIVDSVLGQLADESNRVLAELGTPIRVDLRSQRVTKDNRLVDALEIIVLDGTDEAPYETLSGGERTRVALALRAALTRLLAAKNGARVRLLVVDEPSGLDANGAEAFADVLQAFIAAAIFETAIIVTHDERLADRIDRVVRVEKTPGGTSRLVENRGPTTPDAIEPDPGGADHGARTTVRAAASGIGRDGSHA